MFYRSLKSKDNRLFILLYSIYVVIGGVFLITIFNINVIDMIDMLTFLSFSSIIAVFLSYITMAISDRTKYYSFYI